MTSSQRFQSIDSLKEYEKDDILEYQLFDGSRENAKSEKKIKGYGFQPYCYKQNIKA